MKIPEKVRVGSMIYSVTQSGKPLILNGRKCTGLVDYEKHTIDIDNETQDAQGSEQTFLHELVHAIVRERNFKLDADDDEMVVDELASGLHQVILDNPDVFK